MLPKNACPSEPQSVKVRFCVRRKCRKTRKKQVFSRAESKHVQLRKGWGSRRSVPEAGGGGGLAGLLSTRLAPCCSCQPHPRPARAPNTHNMRAKTTKLGEAVAPNRTCPPSGQTRHQLKEPAGALLCEAPLPAGRPTRQAGVQAQAAAQALAAALAWVALQISTKVGPLREAPPTRKPSTSSSLASCPQLVSVTACQCTIFKVTIQFIKVIYAGANSISGAGLCRVSHST